MRQEKTWRQIKPSSMNQYLDFIKSLAQIHDQYLVFSLICVYLIQVVIRFIFVMTKRHRVKRRKKSKIS